MKGLREDAQACKITMLDGTPLHGPPAPQTAETAQPENS